MKPSARPMPLRPTCALILPILNEIRGLEAILPRIDRTLFDDIVVVDGGSTDGSIEYCHANGLRVVAQDGKGVPDALATAVRTTATDTLILFSPDGNSVPEKLAELRQKMDEGYDLVIVSRYRDGAVSEDDDIVTAFGNRLFTTLVNVLFRARYTDVFVIFRGIRRDAIRRMELVEQKHATWVRRNVPHVHDWMASSAARAARLKLKVAEIGGNEPARIGGQRKLLVFRHGLGVLYQIVEDFLLFRR